MYFGIINSVTKLYLVGYCYWVILRCTDPWILNFVFHCLRLFHSPILRSLSFMAVYIPSFQVLRGRLRCFLLPGFQWIIVLGSRVGSILSTWPYQISCSRVMSSNIISCESIFPLIYSFVSLSSVEILVDRLNSSISVCTGWLGLLTSRIPSAMLAVA